MAARIIRINDIIDEVLSHHPEADISLIQRAYVFSAQSHEGQVRLSGEPYLSHPLEVAYLLAQMGLDPVSVACGLLHDTVEDTHATLDDLDELFGEEVADIINGVTRISQISFDKKIDQQAEYIRKMILAMAHDIRVILVKLADRVHNMRTLGFMKPESQRRIAQETLDIFAPLAGRLGMGHIKAELEDLAFFYLEPEIYQRIQDGLARKRGEREKYIKEISEVIQTKLAAHHLRGEVKGRPKHFYGIYRKMQAQQISLEQVYDLIAFRIIVETKPECYETLGIIHDLWRPVPGRFKDYIAMPKANKYQSLHTTVIGPYGERMEIQIRTREMDEIAEKGIAAHWAYKERRQVQQDDNLRFSWLRQIIEWQKDLTNPQDFLDTVRVELYPEVVFVFTPKGEVKELPRGSTPVDFAYAIHSEVGHRCTGARVNGRMVPLKYELQHGDNVEIITSPTHTPSRDWLQFVRTARARSRIKQYLKTVERERSIALGREILEREFRKAGLNLGKLLKSEEELQRVAKDLSFVRIDDLLAGVGFGKISANQVIGKLLPKEETPPAAAEVPVKAITRATAADRGGIRVKGLNDILINLARCCNPIPGDKITGYITKGKGVTIHRSECPILARTETLRHVPAAWDGVASGRHPVRIQVFSVDKPGLLAEITNALKQAEVNVVKATAETTVDQKSMAWFTIEVTGTAHLEKVLSNIKRVKNVIGVHRLMG
ncbi:MAG: RelA/SpoT family protein [Desulfobacca sp.]|uniref:RelA/SpoT family protein n=1 Tax=Desulfobacca sp. TaxID=2067990 RepID=UPI00404B1EC4